MGFGSRGVGAELGGAEHTGMQSWCHNEARVQLDIASPRFQYSSSSSGAKTWKEAVEASK